jgi:hypothetical protein
MAGALSSHANGWEYFVTWRERIVLGAWALVATTVIAGAISVSHVGFVNAPYFDEWLNAYPGDYLARLFERYNGHPLIIERLALAADYYAFDAQGWALRYGQLVLLAMAVVCVWRLGALAGLQSVFARGALAAFAAVALFNPQLGQNFSWGFQFTFTLAFVVTIAAATCLAEYAAAKRKPWLVACFIFSTLAAFSLGNGLAAPFLMALMAWRLGLDRKIWLGLAALSVVCALILFLMPPDSSSALSPLAAPERGFPNPVDALAYAFRVLGSAPATTLASFAAVIGVKLDAQTIGAIFGVLLSGGAAYLAAPVLLRRDNPALTAAAALALFAGVSALMIGVLRSGWRDELALSSRYTLISALLIVALGVLVAARLKSWSPRLALPALLAGALAALIVPIGAAAVTADYAVKQHNRAARQAAIVAGVEMQAGLGVLGGMTTSAALVQDTIAQLRADRTWLFADPWSHRIGEHIEVSDARRCASRVQTGARRTAHMGFAALNGEIGAPAARQGRTVVILDGEGVMRGYGLVLRRSLGTIVTAPNSRLKWVGYTQSQPEATQTLTAFVAGPEGVVCRIGDASINAAAATPRTPPASH